MELDGEPFLRKKKTIRRVRMSQRSARHNSKNRGSIFEQPKPNPCHGSAVILQPNSPRNAVQARGRTHCGIPSQERTDLLKGQGTITLLFPLLPVFQALLRPCAFICTTTSGASLHFRDGVGGIARRSSYAPACSGGAANTRQLQAQAQRHHHGSATNRLERAAKLRRRVAFCPMACMLFCFRVIFSDFSRFSRTILRASPRVTREGGGLNFIISYTNRPPYK